MTSTARPGRNDRCHCGSGKKYKQCCLAADDAAQREARAEAAEAEAAAPTAPAEPETSRRKAPTHQRGEQPWKRSAQNTRGFQKFTGPRKVGSG